jgi:L-lactate dehydrogenase complex protein LldF
VRLDIPRMLLQLRKTAVEESPVPWTLRLGMRAFGLIAARPVLFRAGLVLARVAGRLFPGGWIRRLPGLGGGWTRMRDLKAPAPQSFQEMWRRRKRGKA